MRIGKFPAPRKDKCGKRLWVWAEVEKYLSAADATPLNEGGLREATKRISQGG